MLQNCWFNDQKPPFIRPMLLADFCWITPSFSRTSKKRCSKKQGKRMGGNVEAELDR